jgi:CBS-domain-containing membrane protein
VNATVEDVMTVTVISVKRDTPFEAIAAALRENRVSAFPVTDDESAVIGLVSESDLLAKLAFGIGDDDARGINGILSRHQLEKARAVTAADLMTSPAVTVGPGDPVEQAAKLMYKHNVKRLPVIDADGHLCGIVSRTDVLAVFTRTDADVAEEIRNSIFPNEEHVEGRPFDVSVQSGVVTVYGAPLAAEQGYRMIRQARHVQGVVAVRDRLDYPRSRSAHFDVLAGFPAD